MARAKSMASAVLEKVLLKKIIETQLELKITKVELIFFDLFSLVLSIVSVNRYIVQ
jgi:hypothetical protein